MDNFNHSELSREEILSLLMDGELHNANEQALFAEMAKDTDLQAQLKDTLAIREAIKSDTEAFAPPPDLTAELFGKLGYADKPKIPALGFDWSRFMKRAAAPLMLLMLAITLPLIYNASTDTNVADASSVPVVSSVSTDVDASENNSQQINKEAVASGENIYTESNIQQSKRSDQNNNRYISNNTNAATDLPASGSLSAENYTSNESPAEFAPMQNQEQNRVDISISKISTNEYTDFAFSSSDGSMNPMELATIRRSRTPRQWTMHLRGIYNISRDGKSMQEFNPVKSFAGGAMMQISDNMFFGLEGGREVYNFSNTDPNLYEDPYVFWYALSFRYDLNSMDIAGIKPYFRLNGGGSSRGPVFAAYLGGEYKLTDTYALMFSYGASLLTYKSNNLQYATAKTGLNFGINLRF